MCACCFKTEDFPVPVLPLAAAAAGGVEGAQEGGAGVGVGVTTARKSRAVTMGPAYSGV